MSDILQKFHLDLCAAFPGQTVHTECKHVECGVESDWLAYDMVLPRRRGRMFRVILIKRSPLLAANYWAIAHEIYVLEKRYDMFLRETIRLLKHKLGFNMFKISGLLIAAIISVESGGNNSAISQSGNEVGCMQITRGVIQDVNERLHESEHYVWPRSAMSRESSIAIFNLYMERYATRERLGHEPTFEDIARIWNGGPEGYHNECTLRYWHKVELALRDQQ